MFVEVGHIMAKESDINLPFPKTQLRSKLVSEDYRILGQMESYMRKMPSDVPAYSLYVPLKLKRNCEAIEKLLMDIMNMEKPVDSHKSAASTSTIENNLVLIVPHLIASIQDAVVEGMCDKYTKENLNLLLEVSTNTGEEIIRVTAAGLIGPLLDDIPEMISNLNLHHGKSKLQHEDIIRPSKKAFSAVVAIACSVLAVIGSKPIDEDKKLIRGNQIKIYSALGADMEDILKFLEPPEEDEKHSSVPTDNKSAEAIIRKIHNKLYEDYDYEYENHIYDEENNDINSAMKMLVETAEGIMKNKIYSKKIAFRNSLRILLVIITKSLTTDYLKRSVREVVKFLAIHLTKNMNECVYFKSGFNLYHPDNCSAYKFLIPERNQTGWNAITEYYRIKVAIRETPIIFGKQSSKKVICRRRSPRALRRIETLFDDPNFLDDLEDQISDTEKIPETIPETISEADSESFTDSMQSSIGRSSIFRKASTPEHSSFKNIEKYLEDDEKNCSRDALFFPSGYTLNCLGVSNKCRKWPDNELKRMIQYHLNIIQDSLTFPRMNWSTHAKRLLESIG